MVAVLVGFAEALSAPESVWSLADAGFRVHACARRGRRSALRRSRFVSVHEITAPESDSAKCQSEFSELCARLSQTESGAHVFLPLDDAALWLGAKTSMPSGWINAGPNEEQAELALDKWKQLELARASGFQVPPSELVTSREELERLAGNWPRILRPVKAITEGPTRLLKGANWICNDRAELLRAATRWEEKSVLLAQPYLPGVGEGIFGLATTAGVIGWSAHRRLRMMNPHGSGSSACVSKPVEEALREPAERFVRQAGWRGMFMIELLRGPNGSCSFVEFNGRAWGSMTLARRQGLEYPAWTVQLALDRDFSPKLPTRASRETECRNLGRELMHLLFVLRGPKSRALQTWPSAWATVRNFFHGLRGSVFYNYRAGDRRVFLSDTLNTLRDQIIKRKS